MMTKSFKRHLMIKCIQDNLGCWRPIRTDCNDVQQSQLPPISDQTNHNQAIYRGEETDVLKRNSFVMDLSRVIGDKQQSKEQNINSTSKSTSRTSSRSNSVEGVRTVDNNDFNSSLNHLSTLHCNSTATVNNFSVPILTNSSSTLAYSNSGQPSPSLSSTTNGLSNTTAAYNVNQDFLIRMAMQSNTPANSAIVSNANSMFTSNKFYNENLAAVAAAVANGNPHSLYQQALNVTSNSNNSTSNSSTISAPHNLAALNSPHSSAFQNLQTAHSSHPNQSLHHQQQSIQSNSINTNHLTNSHTNGHSSIVTVPTTGSDHLISSMTNSSLNGTTNQSLLVNVTNGLINNSTTSLSSTLSNGGSTNSSTSSSSNGSSGLALIESSTNNLFSGIKKRKRSPQPIPQDLKDDAYWDRRRRNNESAKRSREVRRIKEQGIALRLAYLEKRNLQLSTELEMMKEEAKKMHDIIYCQRYGQNNQQDKHL